MNFANPGWLWATLPWGGVVAYLVASGRPATAVPHLALWRHEGELPRPAGVIRWRWPAWIVLALLGLLAAIGAAAGPTVGPTPGREATVVLDRGFTMASTDDGAYRGTVDRAAELLAGRRATLVCVPPFDDAGGDWASRARAAPPTAFDTGDAVATAVAAAVRQGTAPVYVLTDRTALPADSRVVRVVPAGAGGVGIVGLSARDRPWPQIRVRLANREGRSTACRVRITSDGQVGRTAEATFADGQTAAEVFVDMPALGATVTVTADPAAVDGRAWLATGGRRPWVTTTPGLPSAVSGVVAAFNATEGAVGGPAVLVSDRPLPAGQAGVRIVPSTEPVGGTATVAEHPVTADVRRWTGGGGPAPRLFTPVVTVAGRVVVAVRDGPPRQVWADLDVVDGPRSADWVVFFANALRWVSGDGQRYTSADPVALTSDWQRVADGGPPMPTGVGPGLWPGLYRRSEDGAVLAVHAGGAVPVAAGPRPSDGGADRPTRAPLMATLAATGVAVASVLRRGHS